MNNKAFEKLDYSLALLSAVADGKNHGCIINSLHQATSSYPPKFTVTLSRDHETRRAVEASGSFCATLLSADCPAEIIDQYGYKSGRVTDKFAGVEVKTDENGNPYRTDSMVARISCKVVNKVEIGNYVLYVGEVTSSEVLSPDGVLTLKAFSDRGKAVPPAATAYRTVDVNGYRCSICGYVYEGESLPADFICPICHATADKFTLFTPQ